jgi:hypothetical protein
MSVFSLIPKLYFNLLGLGFLMGTDEIVYDMAFKADWARKHGQISLSALNHQLQTGGRSYEKNGYRSARTSSKRYAE